MQHFEPSGQSYAKLLNVNIVNLYSVEIKRQANHVCNMTRRAKLL